LPFSANYAVKVAVILRKGKLFNAKNAGNVGLFSAKSLLVGSIWFEIRRKRIAGKTTPLLSQPLAKRSSATPYQQIYGVTV